MEQKPNFKGGEGGKAYHRGLGGGVRVMVQKSLRSEVW